MTKRALIVIDVQKEYFPGGKWALPASEQALPNILRLVSLARERGEKVVYVQHFLPAGAPVFADGTPGCELHDQLDVRPDDAIVQKPHPSAFMKTNLQELLQGEGVEAVDICGFMTQMCCDTTTREAFSRGYKVRLFSDATAAKDLDADGEIIPHHLVHKAELVSLKSFAEILPTDQA